MMNLMIDFASSYLAPVWTKKKAGEKHEQSTDSDFAEVFYGFTEINSALDTLTLTEELLRLAPPRSKRIDKDNYLKFLVGSYLQEVYILEQRLTAYAKKISRMYRKPTLPALVKQIVYEPMQAIINIRGAHVHQRRFTNDRLDMVSTMALFRRVGHERGEDLELEYKFAQIQWSVCLKKNNKVTREIVSRYCALLKTVICDDGKIFLPKSRL